MWESQILTATAVYKSVTFRGHFPVVSVAQTGKNKQASCWRRSLLVVFFLNPELSLNFPSSFIQIQSTYSTV